LHMSQLMPLPLTVSCFNKIQIGYTFLVPAHLGSPGKRAVKRACVCVGRVNLDLQQDPILLNTSADSHKYLHTDELQHPTVMYSLLAINQFNSSNIVALKPS